VPLPVALKIVCAVVSVSPCVPRMCHVPTCCTRLATKFLATSLLVEAFLYEEQTRRGISIRHWEEFEDVADHCTVCHKCLTPCPVDIDFGDVSMNMRNLLRKMGKKSFNPGTSAAMFFLNATDPATINATRQIDDGLGL
jgi:Fe-S oxidoreductase